MLLLALAAQFSIPILDKGPVFSSDLWPPGTAASGRARRVYTRTTVRPDGTIQGCTIELTSEDDAVDAFTCNLIVKRAGFRGAKWIDGSPSYGVIRFPVTWAPDGSLRYGWNYPTLPDLQLTVNQLPGRMHSVDVAVQIAADAQGRVTACKDIPPEDGLGSKGNLPELVSAACGALMSSFSAAPARDDAGKPVRSVQVAHVQFKTGR